MGTLYVSLPDALAVRIVHLGGGTESIPRGSADRKALSAELVHSWIDETINTTARDERGNALNTSEGMQLYARRLHAMPYPDSLPVTDQFVVDMAGYLWVREYQATRTGLAKWWILDPDGQGQQDLELPANLRIMEIGPHYIAGVEVDEFDVQRVKVYTLMRHREVAAS
jgi:hypothetical protein